MKTPPTKEAAAPAETGTAERNEEHIHNASQPAKSKQQIHRPFIPAWLDDAGLSAAEMRVFIHLLRSADNQTGIAWPSYRRMIEVTGLSKTTIRRCIESLENPHALIAKLGKPFAGSCRYKVLPIVPPQGQKEDSNSSATGAIEAAPIVPPQTRNSSTTGTPIVPLQGQEGNPKKETQRRESTSLAETIYQAYPRKVAKSEALRAISRAMKANDPDFLLERTTAYATAISWKDKQFIPYPATWFNKGMFNDDPDEWKEPTNNTRPCPTRGIRENLEIPFL